MEHVTAAAILFEGKVYSVPRPGRHCDVIGHIVGTVPGVKVVTGPQGFLVSEGAAQGRFVDRKEARRIAEAAGQLIAGRKDEHGARYVATDDTLYSEDVW